MTEPDKFAVLAWLGMRSSRTCGDAVRRFWGDLPDADHRRVETRIRLWRHRMRKADREDDGDAVEDDDPEVWESGPSGGEVVPVPAAATQNPLPAPTFPPRAYTENETRPVPPHPTVVMEPREFVELQLTHLLIDIAEARRCGDAGLIKDLDTRISAGHQQLMKYRPPAEVEPASGPRPMISDEALATMSDARLVVVIRALLSGADPGTDPAPVAQSQD